LREDIDRAVAQGKKDNESLQAKLREYNDEKLKVKIFNILFIYLFYN